MEDKQIYAYSWQKDLKKRIKDYFENLRNKKETPVVTEIDKLPQVVNDTSSKSIKSKKSEAKEQKTKKPGSSKKQKEAPGSPLIRKEKMEKTLTLTIGSLILFVMLLGILAGTGVINLSQKEKKIADNVAISQTVTVAPLSNTPSPEHSLVPTTKNTPTPLIRVSSISPVQTNCKISGCNGEICADENLGEISSICLYQEKYECFQKTTCERQADGKCGWTKNQEYMACLDQHR